MKPYKGYVGDDQLEPDEPPYCEDCQQYHPFRDCPVALAEEADFQHDLRKER